MSVNIKRKKKTKLVLTLFASYDVFGPINSFFPLAGRGENLEITVVVKAFANFVSLKAFVLLGPPNELKVFRIRVVLCFDVPHNKSLDLRVQTSGISTGWCDLSLLAGCSSGRSNGCSSRTASRCAKAYGGGIMRHDVFCSKSKMGIGWTCFSGKPKFSRPARKRMLHTKAGSTRSKNWHMETSQRTKSHWYYAFVL